MTLSTRGSAALGLVAGIIAILITEHVVGISAKTSPAGFFALAVFIGLVPVALYWAVRFQRFYGYDVEAVRRADADRRWFRAWTQHPSQPLNVWVSWPMPPHPRPGDIWSPGPGHSLWGWHPTRGEWLRLPYSPAWL